MSGFFQNCCSVWKDVWGCSALTGLGEKFSVKKQSSLYIQKVQLTWTKGLLRDVKGDVQVIDIEFGKSAGFFFHCPTTNTEILFAS